MVREVVEVEQAGINSPIIVCFYREGLARTVGVYFLDWTDLRNDISPFVSRHPSYRGHPFVFFFRQEICAEKDFHCLLVLGACLTCPRRPGRGGAFGGATAALTCEVLWVRLVVSGFDRDRVLVT